MLNPSVLKIVEPKQLIKIQIKKQDYELPKMIIHGPVVATS